MVQFPSSINHEELVAPATPSISSNVSPISPSESFYARAALMDMDHTNDLAMNHTNDLADEAIRPAKRGLFSCLAELNAQIASRGRDAFVAEIIAKKRDDYIYIPYLSRKSEEGDKEGIIYAVCCLVNGKTYVGQTNSFGRRMGLHFSGRGRARYLAKAINFYGRNNFVCVILLAGIEQHEDLNFAEIAVIKSLDCLNRGYNIHPGGSGGPTSQEARNKMSAKKLGKPLTDEHKAAISTTKKGKTRVPLTEAHKAAISATKKGRARSAVAGRE